jgi:ribosomal 50S subunit-recycling heat shock protein
MLKKAGHGALPFWLGGKCMRLDKWLKVSRIMKRRTVANEACDNGRVTANGRPVKASYDVKVGDVLELKFGEKLIRLEVLSTADIVGKADAAAMYQELR